MNVTLHRLPLGADAFDGWTPLHINPTTLVRAALQRETEVPLGIIPGGFDWTPGDVLRLTVKDEGSDTHVLGVLARSPTSGERFLALAPAVPDERDETFGAGPNVAGAYALWRGEHGASTLLRWCRRVPQVRALHAARIATGAAMVEHRLFPRNLHDLYTHASAADRMGLQYVLAEVRRSATRPKIEQAAELLDTVRETRAAHGLMNCVAVAVCYFAEAALQSRALDDVSAITPSLAATAVLWAEAGAENPAVVRAAVHRAIPLWAFVAALAGVPEDHCG